MPNVRWCVASPHICLWKNRTMLLCVIISFIDTFNILIFSGLQLYCKTYMFCPPKHICFTLPKLNFDHLKHICLRLPKLMVHILIPPLVTYRTICYSPISAPLFICLLCPFECFHIFLYHFIIVLIFLSVFLFFLCYAECSYLTFYVSFLDEIQV